MVETENKFNGLYYVFDYDIEEEYAIERISLCDFVESNGNNISEDICVPTKFTTSFLCTYAYLSNKFNDENNNTFREYLKQSPHLLRMLENACSEDNVRKTKIDFENIERFLKNESCQNSVALYYFCRFANKKLPSPIGDVYKNIPLLKQEDETFNYLKNNIKYQKGNNLIIDAENILGMKVYQNIVKIQTPMDLFLVTLNILYQLKWAIRFCKICGFPFLVSKRKKTIYCSYNKNSCKVVARREKERKRYTNERNRLYRNIKGKFEYRESGFEDDPWKELKKQFFKVYDNDDNKKNKNLVSWLKKVDSLFFVHKNEPFKLPDINSI